MMVFLTIALNLLFGGSIIAFVIWRLGWHPEAHNCLERLSLGFMGAGMLLSLPSAFQIATPFDYWSQNMVRGASLAFFYAIFATRRWRPVDLGKSCLQLLKESRLK